MDELIRHFIDNIFDGTVESIKMHTNNQYESTNNGMIRELNMFILSNNNFVAQSDSWGYFGFAFRNSIRRIFE